jgi:hypothetical protein
MTKQLETAAFHGAVTKSDSADIALINGRGPRALRIGGAGDVAVVDQRGTVVVYTCVAGEVLEVKAKRVNSTSTDATGIVAWY